MKVEVELKIASHGNWENTFKMLGEYDDVIEQLDKFYEIIQKIVAERIRLEKTYHEGVKSHLIKSSD